MEPLASFSGCPEHPLITEHGNQLGIVSTHFANVHAPSNIEMETLKAYGVVAAQYVFKLLGETPLDVAANRMHESCTLACSISRDWPHRRGVAAYPHWM
jgi:hypothetical protein